MTYTKGTGHLLIHFQKCDSWKCKKKIKIKIASKVCWDDPNIVIFPKIGKWHFLKCYSWKCKDIKCKNKYSGPNSSVFIHYSGTFLLYFCSHDFQTLQNNAIALFLWTSHFMAMNNYSLHRYFWPEKLRCVFFTTRKKLCKSSFLVKTSA